MLVPSPSTGASKLGLVSRLGVTATDPGAHGAHAEAPAAGVKAPAAQAVQTAALEAPAWAPYVPAAHATHSAGLLAPGVELYAPAAHAVQCTEVGAPGVVP